MFKKLYKGRYTEEDCINWTDQNYYLNVRHSGDHNYCRQSTKHEIPWCVIPGYVSVSYKVSVLVLGITLNV